MVSAYILRYFKGIVQLLFNLSIQASLSLLKKRRRDHMPLCASVADLEPLEGGGKEKSYVL